EDEAASLEAECHLKIDSAIVGARTEWPAGQRVLSAKNRRANHANRICRIHVVENIPRKDRKCQAVFLPGIIAKRSASATAAPDANRTTASAKGSATHSWPTGVACCFVFLAKSKSFAQAQVQRKTRRSCGAIYRHDCTRIRFVAIEADVVSEL